MALVDAITVSCNKVCPDEHPTIAARAADDWPRPPDRKSQTTVSRERKKEGVVDQLSPEGAMVSPMGKVRPIFYLQRKARLTECQWKGRLDDDLDAGGTTTIAAAGANGTVPKSSHGLVGHKDVATRFVSRQG